MSTFTRRSFIGKTAVAVGSFAALRDVQLAEWTKEAIEKNQRKLITDGDDVTVKSETGLLVSPGGGPVRTTGILVNCPVVGFTNE
jgi:hypothetical protein